MSIIANLWWVWLLLALLSAAYGIFSQLRRMSRMKNSFFTETEKVLNKSDIGQVFSSVNRVVNDASSGLGLTVFALFIAGASGIMFIISLILNLVK